MAEREKRLARLSPLKRQLLDLLLQEQREGLREGEQSAESPSLIVLQDRPSDQIPLICVHPVAGNIFCYNTLASLLGEDRPVYLFQAQGLEGAGVAMRTVEEMAARYISELHRQRAGPYFLAGWSMGGVIAFEMACKLQASGEEVAMLAIIDADATNDQAAASDPVWLPSSSARADSDLSVIVERLKSTGVGANMGGLVELGKALDLIPEYLSSVDLSRVLKVYQANVSALRMYRPRATYAGHILLFKAAEQAQAADEMLGWGGWAHLGVDVQVVPGDHFSLLKQPAVGIIASHLMRRMLRAETNARVK